MKLSPALLSLPLLLSAGALAGCGAADSSQTGSASETETTSEALTSTTSYSCTSPIGNVTATAKVTGTAPASTTAGSAISLHKFQWTVTLPASLINEAISFGATSASGEATTLDVNVTDSTPKSKNAAATPIAFGPVPLVENQALAIPFPATAETLGKFTAGSAGTMTFKPGKMDFNVTLSGLGTSAITCTTTAAKAFAHTTVN